MILRQILKKTSQHIFTSQVRNIRPVIKMGKSRFEISIDVRQFKAEELCVKAREEYVMIEGKQERKSADGLIVRQFCRKFKLPKGCDPEKMKSVLSADGVLTITAKRETCSQNLPCETRVPIGASAEDDQQKDVSMIEPKSCDTYFEKDEKFKK